MIHIEVKEKCCGCEACVQICPKECIILHQDDEGFLYPKVNTSLCINCELCEKVCPVINQGIPVQETTQALGIINRDNNIRERSSSGGVFDILARDTLSKNGIVFGATFDKDFNVIHTSVETIEELPILYGAKYLQSRIGFTYKEAQFYLKQGRKVLFSGAPCQIKALKLFLHKDYENLTTVDFICHGIPSPLIWQEYLQNEIKPPFKVINFRDKIYGWSNMSLSFIFSDKRKKKNISLKNLDRNNYFMKAFLRDIILRPSCYACPSKAHNNDSDITIADYWGIQEIDASLFDDKGTSLVILHHPQKFPHNIWENCIVKKYPIEIPIKKNMAYNISVKPHPKRDQFFNYYKKNHNLKGALAYIFPVSLKEKITFACKRSIKYFLPLKIKEKLRTYFLENNSEKLQ